MTEKFKRQLLHYLGYRDEDPAAMVAVQAAWDLGYRDAFDALGYARRELARAA